MRLAARVQAASWAAASEALTAQRALWAVIVLVVVLQVELGRASCFRTPQITCFFLGFDSAGASARAPVTFAPATLAAT